MLRAVVTGVGVGHIARHSAGALGFTFTLHQDCQTAGFLSAEPRLPAALTLIAGHPPGAHGYSGDYSPQAGHLLAGTPWHLPCPTQCPAGSLHPVRPKPLTLYPDSPDVI